MGCEPAIVGCPRYSYSNLYDTGLALGFVLSRTEISSNFLGFEG
jgi:hypothetical protein